MNSKNNLLYDYYRRTFRIYLGSLLGIVVIFGILHYFFSDLRIGKVYWLNLDKERNIYSWFSGTVFFLFGCAAIVAYYLEQKHNSKGQSCFRLPILWLGIGLTGLFMSLDEITILHENLYWREVRQVSAQIGNPLKYVTQWQILFAPAIIIVLGYFILFFSNRFSASLSGRRSTFTGIGCWLVALLLEGLRGTFKQKGDSWYSFEVIIEEMMEPIGAIFLLSSIVFYIIDISLDFTSERRDRLMLASRFFTKKASRVLGIVFIILLFSGGTIYLFAQIQASKNVPVPRLVKKALRSQSNLKQKDSKVKSSFTEVSHSKIWFEDIKEPVTINKSDEEYLVRFITTSILEKESMHETFPVALRKDTFPRIVFLSVSDGLNPAHVVMGSGYGITKAVESALSKIQILIEKDYRPKWVKLDLVQDVYSVDNVNFDNPIELERSLQGIAFDRHLGIAFLPEELVAYTLVNSKRKIRKSNIVKYMNRQYNHTGEFYGFQPSRNLTLYFFSTVSFFSDGNKIFSLYRGHRLFEQISKEDLLFAARMAGKYLTQALSDEGKFVYTYLPKTDDVSEKYNILRHAGTIFSMLELYEITSEPGLMHAARLAIEYLLQSAKPYERGKEDIDCIVEKGYVKLGGNALAAIALAKYIELTDDRKYMPMLLRLCRWIKKAQKENGNFYIQKLVYSDREATNFVSQYYPGEAILALVRLYSITQDKDWLNTAEKGAQYLINVRDKGVPPKELIHDHWLLYALNELYRYRPDPSYLNHSLRIALAIMLGQNRNPEFPDYLGSYYDPPRSTPAATRSEGLLAAYRLARDFGKEAEAQRMMETINLNMRFQLQTQFYPETVMYVNDPQRCLGAFHHSLTNFKIRIDYVQHNISALLGLYRILEAEKKIMR